MSILLQDAEVFGLGWIGNKISVKQMPLLNIIFFCGNSPSTVVSIVDCTSHMSDGENNDAIYFMEILDKK